MSAPLANVSLPMNTSAMSGYWRAAPTTSPAIVEIAQTVVDKAPTTALSAISTRGYRQLGSQICMFHVACEIGIPVRIGYIHAKFVITSAT